MIIDDDDTDFSLVPPLRHLHHSPDLSTHDRLSHLAKTQDTMHPGLPPLGIPSMPNGHAHRIEPMYPVIACEGHTWLGYAGKAIAPLTSCWSTDSY